MTTQTAGGPRRVHDTDLTGPVLPVRDQAGGEVIMRYVLSPLGEPGTPPVGIVLTAVDVSAEARLERSSRRSRLLAEISERMNATSDPVAALKALTDQLVPTMADVA